MTSFPKTLCFTCTKAHLNRTHYCVLIKTINDVHQAINQTCKAQDATPPVV